MAQAKHLATTNLTDIGQELIDYLLRLPMRRLNVYFEQWGLDIRGVRSDLRARIEAALSTKKLSLETLKETVDEETLSGRQHVFLFDGPAGSISKYSNATSFKKLADQEGKSSISNAEIPIELTANLQLVRLVHTPTYIELVAAERREYWERTKDLDTTSTVADGQLIRRAFMKRIDRGFVRFQWHTSTNTAFVTLTQLPGNEAVNFDRYAKKFSEFADLVGPLLPLSSFAKLDMRKVIEHLHDSEIAGKSEARLVVLGYKATSGHMVTVRSPSTTLRVTGNTAVDTGLRAVKSGGRGRKANCHWLPSGKSHYAKCSLSEEIHTDIIAGYDRINFPAWTNQKDLMYVLGRIRAAI